MTIYVGVDPGAEGAYAVAREKVLLAAARLPIRSKIVSGKTKGGHKRARTVYDPEEIWRLALGWLDLAGAEPLVVILEVPGARPTDRPISAWQLATYCATLATALAIAAATRGRGRMSIRTPPPSQWRSWMLGTGADKERAIRVARALHPGHLLGISRRARKPDHNVAEAVLLAEYGRRLDAGLGPPRLRTRTKSVPRSNP
jgi:hypothetical protein